MILVASARSTNGGRADFLAGDAIAALWRDPILRFGKVLDGLFHDGVIVAEADGDCRFYEAISAATVSSQQSADIHYTYSGGKDRIPILVRALACLNVPVATIVDFDVLNNERPLRPIVEAHGGDWSQVEPDWLVLKEAVEAKSAFIGGDRFRSEMKTLLASIPPGESVPKEILKKVRSLARNASPWDHVKDTGVDAVARGDARQAALRLLALLKTIGIFVAPKGQMESFCPTIGPKGTRWVEEALRRDLKIDPELTDARLFAEEVQTYLRQRVM
jgi:hypothetical protein